MLAESQAGKLAGISRIRDIEVTTVHSDTMATPSKAIPPDPLCRAMVRTLLYYDIWDHPLTGQELFAFLPVNSVTPEEFRVRLREAVSGGCIQKKDEYYYVGEKTSDVVRQRIDRERHARTMWFFARISMHIIKRFPFVRGVMVSGELSKNVTGKSSDVDFFVVTAPGRLWIARTLLILFKKTFLLNRKKFFCLNYFATADHLELEDQNIFLATEVATLKPLFNTGIFLSYLQANSWIKEYFPNFDMMYLAVTKANDRPSFLQRILELPFALLPANALDRSLQSMMEGVWARRYPEYDEETRKRIFRCSRFESRAYVGDFENKILARYDQRLRDFGVNA
jgi:hypothetical protein